MSEFLKAEWGEFDLISSGKIVDYNECSHIA